MGHLVMSTGNMRSAMRLLTAVERTPDQERCLGHVRAECARKDERLRSRGVDLEVSVAQALEQLLDGEVDGREGPAWTYALHALIAAHFSDTHDLGDWARQSWFSTVDEELSAAGVPPHLSISEIIMSGPPVRVPFPGDTVPWMGTFPTAEAAAFVAAHEAVFDLVEPEVRETAEYFVKAMRFEAEEWEAAEEGERVNDTLFFWCS
ncbi:DUF7691 family protein [Streptomyces sp. NPDC054904]|uniref:DUF7691 family protein n=1 Tax=unclassified Streptomyces TaxID=2593676 RepID=UPI002481E979|nr:hypothetical protein [Streptomyces sp. Isolate_45]MDA5283660.1 hypothetical protein [Streptomyces sp. Isolate_45]